MFGYTDGATITNLGIANCAIEAEKYAGGLIGYAEGITTIEDCYATGYWYGYDGAVGGLIGYAEDSVTMENCYVSGYVEGSYPYVGGLIGYANDTITIKNCYVTGTVDEYWGGGYSGGLVGYATTAEIQSSYSTANVFGDNDHVGGLVGYADSVTIENCYATGAITGSENNVGGLVGTASNLTIKDSYATGVITGEEDNVGGLVGSASNLTIENCYAAGLIKGEKNNVGGLVGSATDAEIQNTYSTATVVGAGKDVGGLVGYASDIAIENCYATGSVTGDGGNVGGLVGEIAGSAATTIKNCFATGAVSGNDNVGGLVGNSNGTTNTIQNSVALNSSITGTSSDANRVLGYDGTKSATTLLGNYAWNDMTVDDGSGPVAVTGGSTTNANGEDLTYPSSFVSLQTIFANDGAWDYTGELPTLNDVGGTQIINLPYYITTTHTTTISTVEELQALAAYVNAGNTASGMTFTLQNDLDLSGISNWTPIGTSSDEFRGDFDGGGYTISNLTINSSDDDYQGLFGFMDGNIKNLTLENCNVSGDSKVGGLVGYINGTNAIENCYVTGTVSGNSYVGGLVGYADGSITITESYATGAVAGSGVYVGGLVGYADNGVIITESYATGTVTGSDDYVGGLVGYAASVTITESYATGTVTGSGNNIGGLVGNVNNSTIQNSYATGMVAGSGDNIGGLVGYANNSTIQNSYATGMVTWIVSGSTISNVGGLVGYAVSSGTLTIANCYATGAVTGNNDRVGGLVGYAENNSSTLDIKNSVVLNQSVFLTGTGTEINRVVGENDSATLSNNYAWIGITINGNMVTTGLHNNEHGADISYTAVTGPLLPQFSVIFNNDGAWGYTRDGLPTITNTNSTQSSDLPYYMLGTVPTDIYDVDDLQTLAIYTNSGGDTNKTFNLMNDLDLSEVANWTQIGTSTHAFEGEFNGNGNVISNLTTNSQTISGQGLFGYVDGANIHDLGLEDCYIAGGNQVGGLVGNTIGTDTTTIKNCYVTGLLTNRYGSSASKGGLVGQSNGTLSIEKSYTTTTISGDSALGGLVGQSNGALSIKDCYTSGNITGDSDAIGGLLGEFNSSSTLTINNCYAMGAISGTEDVGGLVGLTSGTGTKTIENSVALNPSITMTNSGSTANRVIGQKDANTTLADNYAWDDVIVNRNGSVVDIHSTEQTLIATDEVHGADLSVINGIFVVDVAPSGYENLFKDTIALDDTIWVIPTGGAKLPYPKDVGDDRPAMTLTQVYASIIGEVDITFDANGGSSVADITTVSQVLTSLPTPTKSGSTFDGWYLDDVTFTDEVTISTVFSANTTVYAKWTASGGSTPSGSGGSVTIYPIILLPTVDGEVTISDEKPQKGQTITITTIPDDGYVVGNITVTDGDGNHLSVTDLEDGRYIFVQWDSVVEISVEFVLEGLGDGLEEVVLPFVDVATTDFYYDAVIWAWETGITTGKSADLFAPDDVNTRGEAVTFLWRTVGSPVMDGVENPFVDVIEGSYCYDAVLWAVSEGVTLGTTETTFSPNLSCDRSQIATFLYRYVEEPEVNDQHSFVDISEGSFYYNAVLWAVENGITLGTTDSTFSPESFCKRGQIVTFLYRLFGV